MLCKFHQPFQASEPITRNYHNIVTVPGRSNRLNSVQFAGRDLIFHALTRSMKLAPSYSFRNGFSFMARRRKSTDKTTGWMLSAIFNSMLVLLAVIGSQVLGAAFSGSAFSDSPGIEAIDKTRKNMDEAFASFAPRNPSDRYEFWYDVVDRELSERDVAAAHGFLLAAPQMLERKDVKELMVAADAERLDRADDRLSAAALRKLPTAISLKYEEAQVSERVVDVQSEETETPEAAETVAEDTSNQDAPEGPEVEVTSERAAAETRFRLLGTYRDLADNSDRWLHGDRVDEIALKITAIGLLEAESADGLSDANIRAASILKSACAHVADGRLPGLPVRPCECRLARLGPASCARICAGRAGHE